MAEQRLDVEGEHNVAVQNSGDGNSFTISVGAATRLYVTRSHRLGVPVTRPLHLLLAENAVAPLVGRDAVKADLDAWLAGPKPIALRLVTGEGGSGKTRLALDLCACAEEHGWHAGFVSTDELTRFHERTNVEAFRTSEPTLLVVDYAAAKSAILERWLKALARIEQLPGAGKLRLLLLERHGARESGWWQQLLQLGGIEGVRLDALLDPPEPVPLAPITTPRHRRLILRTIMAEASALEGLEPPLTPPAAGEDAWFDRRLDDPAADNSPLLLHMAALAAVQARRSHALDRSRTELALALAEGELVRVRKLAADRGIEPSALHHLVAAVTVEGGADTDGLHHLVDEERRALELAASTAALRDAVRAALPPLLGDGSAAPRLVDAVRPDLIGEALVLRTWARDDVPAAVQEGNIARCWQRAPGATAEALVRLGQDFGEKTTPHVEPPPIHWMLHILASTQDAGALAILADAMPTSTVNLRGVAADVLARLVDLLQAQASLDVFALASRRSELANRLADLGRPDLAVEVETTLAATLRAAATEDGAFEPYLADALGNLSTTLAMLGRRSEALAIGEEVLEIRRRGAASGDEWALEALATTLSNTSNRFADVGQPQRALDAIEEAVLLRRRRVPSERQEADLAGALQNLAIRCVTTGDHARAAAAVEEAVKIYRRLVERRPDAHLPDLARALGNLANIQAAVGQHEPALAAAEEAEVLAAHLEERDAGAFGDGRILALHSLAQRYADVGRGEDALACNNAVVERLLELVKRAPAVYGDWLARACLVRADLLREQGDVDRMLDAYRAGITALSDGFLATPDAFAQLMVHLVGDYFRESLAAGREPDGYRLPEVIVTLRPYLDANGSDNT